MNATARTSVITYNTDASGNVTVIGAATNPSEGTGTMRLSYDGSRALNGINITTPSSGVMFSQGSSGHSVSCSSGTCFAENPTASAVIADPYAPSLNWNYQTFGVWGAVTGPTNSVFGALSAGSPTPGSAVPTSGNAVFNGLTAGFYVDASGTSFATASTMTANVSFSSRSIGFSTSDMTLVNANTGATSTSSGLAISGTLNYASGVNSFSGTVSTQNPALSGSASGRFYGPAAEEMGGTYQLQGSGVQRMIGGFGAKR
jgi:hypothetical protein